MKPVDQVVIHNEDAGIAGDCMRACLASLLELQSEDVPHFVGLYGEDWRRHLRVWLEDRGYMFIQVIDPKMLIALPGTEDHLYAVGGASPRGGFGHMVIGTFSYHDGFTLVHDPHPSRDGIVGDPRVIYIIGRFDRHEI